MSSVRVEANGAWDHRAALTSLTVHSVDGLEVAKTDAGVHRRTLRAGGDFHPVTVQLDSGGVTLETDTEDRGVHQALAEKVSSWFDLGKEIETIDRFFAEDPLLGDQVRTRPGIRVTRFVDGFEAAALTVLGQQVSLAAARGYGSRLVASSGSDGPSGLRLFPSPAEVAKADTEWLQAELRTTGARTRTLQAVAELFAQGFVLDSDSDPLEARMQLLEVPGIGPWTAGYLSIRAMSDPDAFPASDAVLHRALGGADPREIEETSQQWSPLRTYAAMRLWAGQAEA